VRGVYFILYTLSFILLTRDQPGGKEAITKRRGVRFPGDLPVRQLAEKFIDMLEETKIE
jgi:hypothetical protein